MTQPSVRVEQRGHVLLVTIDRPAARNAVDAAVATGLADALDRAEADREVRCVVLTGAGEQAFCAGVDLKALGRGELPFAPGREHYGFGGVVAHPTSTPVVCAVNGAALGGGTELLLAADVAVAARSARFGLPEVQRGLLAAAGGAFRLPEQLPRKVAMHLLLTGEPMPADDALRWGLVNEVVPDEQVLEAALALAGRIAGNAPLAVQASKRLARGMVDGRVVAEAQAWERSEAETAAVTASEDTREGVLAFVEKRPPVWTGR